MAALTATSTQTVNMGSNTCLIITCTAAGTSDTFQMPAGSPILAVWAGSANPGTNAGFVQSTGVITVTNASGTGAEQIFIVLAGC